MPRMPSSSRCLTSSGLTTTRAASRTTKTRKPAISARWGTAKPTDAADRVAGQLLLDDRRGRAASSRSMAPGLHAAHRRPPSWPARSSVSGPSDKFAEPAYLRLALGQPLLLQVARRPPAAAGPWSRGRLRRCWRGRPRPGRTWSRRARREARRRWRCPGRGPRRPRRTSRWRRSPAPASSQQASTRGFVPARSGTRPSAGSFMQNRASSATTRRSQASASWKPAPIA